MSETNLPNPGSQKSPLLESVFRWFLANAAGGLLVALIVYLCTLFGSLTWTRTLHFFGIVSLAEFEQYKKEIARDLATRVSYGDSVSIRAEAGHNAGDWLNHSSTEKVLKYFPFGDPTARVDTQFSFHKGESSEHPE